MPKLTVAFQLFCATCNAGLCGNIRTDRVYDTTFQVDICPRCIKRMRERAFEEGQASGRMKGYAEGFEEVKQQMEEQYAAAIRELYEQIQQLKRER